MADFRKEQGVNDWVKMLHSLYGASQNYNKSPFEIASRLTEVSGLLSKYLLRKKDFARGATFLPKMFGWAVALLKSVSPTEIDLERIILEKYPRVCAYCTNMPCSCWTGEKPTPDPNSLQKLFYQNAASQRRGVNDFHLMFAEIYGATWLTDEAKEKKDLSHPCFRMSEELAELLESVRFHHLYPQNFQNELADFFAWWFALFDSVSQVSGSTLQCDEMLWAEYPAVCLYCQSVPCFCRASPVRELMSKPAPWQTSEFDSLTSLKNQSAYNSDISKIAAGQKQTVFPSACVRADVDSFKAVNDTYGHSAGDAALSHIATVLRRKARERDTLYRVSGDEFGLLLPDCTEEEALGLMKRVLGDLNNSPVRWVGQSSEAQVFKVSLSAGVAECSGPHDIKDAFQRADDAAYESKKAGKNRVTTAKPASASDTKQA